jgi:hypothetical protein
MNKDKAHQQYRLKDGTLVPGITTVCGILDKPALIYWAWNLGMQKLDYRKVRDRAADVGTLAHYMIEQHWKRQEVDLTDFTQKNIEMASLAFQGYLTWERGHDLEILAAEVQLVSEEHWYGGTLDFFGKIDGDYAIIDYKTSKAVYREHKLQLGAGSLLIKENKDIQVTSVHSLLINKEDGSFSHHVFNQEQIKSFEKTFIILAKAYHSLKEIS